MRFSWDELKNRQNLKKHGLDFRDAPQIFSGHIITLQDTRFDYGENRFNTIGLLLGFVVVVTHTELKSPARIISIRKASGPERRFYEKEVLLKY